MSPEPVGTRSLFWKVRPFHAVVVAGVGFVVVAITLFAFSAPKFKAEVDPLDFLTLGVSLLVGVALVKSWEAREKGDDAERAYVVEFLRALEIRLHEAHTEFQSFDSSAGGQQLSIGPLKQFGMQGLHIQEICAKCRQEYPAARLAAIVADYRKAYGGPEGLKNDAPKAKATEAIAFHVALTKIQETTLSVIRGE